MKVSALLAAALLAATGCKASLGDDGNGGGGNNTDASNGGSNQNDAPMQSDAPPACANGRQVFLEFLGVTLTKAANSDSPTNTARWLTNTSAVIPQFRQGGANRAQEITEIVDGVKQRLSTTPITVVTTRPASGPYVMVVLGGANVNNGGTVGTIYSYATSFHDCGDATKNDIAWVSDMTTAASGMNASTEYIADLVIGSIGWSLGLDGTGDGTSCMCGWASSCTNATGACTLSANGTSAITGGNETACNVTQNEVTAFSTGFCQ